MAKKLEKPTSAGSALTDVVLEVFRLNGDLIVSGDRLMSDLGLTSARWQVLGAIEAAQPLSVSQIARNMGLRRQSVQRIVDLLEGEGLLVFSDNPDHRRAKLVSLSKKGNTLMSKTRPLQAEWISNLAKGITIKEIKSTLEVLRLFRSRLETEMDR